MLLKGCGLSSPVSATITRNLPNVWMKTQESDWPQHPLSDTKPHTLKDGDQVKTNEYGEGWLEISNCLGIYIFQDSGLIKTSSNSRLDKKSGNETSQLQGIAAWNNRCANVVIHTNSAEIELKGTWVLVGYLPDSQLTLVMVFEGRAEVQPVLDVNTRTLGEAINVQSGNFLFSTPGDSSGSVADLTAREPHPFEQLQPLLRELNLWAWMAKTREKARKDSIPFPEFLIAQCQIRRNPRLREFPGTEEPILLDAGELADGSSFEGMVQSETGWIFGISSKTIGNSSNAIGWVSSDYLSCPSQLPTALSLPRGISLKEQRPIPTPSPTPTPPSPVPTTSLTTPSPISPSTVDKTPPTINLSISPEKPTTENQVTLTASAQDESGIALIEILVDGTSVKQCRETTSCTATVGPYTLSSESEGITVNVQAQVYDSYGNRGESVSSFVVSNAVPKPPEDTTPPEIFDLQFSPSKPRSGENITLTVTANDPESGVDSISFSADGKSDVCEASSCSITVGPYQSRRNNDDGYYYPAERTVSYTVSANNGVGIPAERSGSLTLTISPSESENNL
jgi:hypothetical protein